MKNLIVVILFLQIISFFSSAQSTINISREDEVYKVIISDKNLNIISSPDIGLWSVATVWEDDWPADWHYCNPEKVEKSGEWTILSGFLDLSGGKWLFRDSYKEEKGMVKCIRRFEWQGSDTLKNVTLSVKWKVRGDRLKAFLPGILYYGNPSGEKNRPEWVPFYHGYPGEMAIFEEHRYPMSFACLESSEEKNMFGATLHTIPSSLKNRNLSDHWWSMGVMAYEGYSELILLSGPVTYNNRKSVAKARQSEAMKYGNTYLYIEPGTVIEKTFYLDVYKIKKRGTAFQQPLYKSLDIFKPYYTEDLPLYKEILQSKYHFAKSRWIDASGYKGFNMYPNRFTPKIVMGWCGQAASCGYAFQNLQKYFNDPELPNMIQQSLDFLSSSIVSKNGFAVQFDTKTKTWSGPDHVSMGQAMYNFAKAIQAAKKNKLFHTEKWEEFFKNTCIFASNRILSSDWVPFSTAEGFYIAPLALGSTIFDEKRFKDAAMKAAKHYADRHLDMKEPYWGGTLDARGEDKEGAWAAFQGFLTLYEITGDKAHLEWAKHACDILLSYTVNRNIPLPPGRMADHAFKTRGWTVVSPQNQHIDIYGVLFSPEIYKMGEILKNDKLKRLAKVMYRSCGQLIDPFGSQGEQLQQTNFAQRGDMNDIYKLRGGYSESWTVFWITAHFLNAAARFEEMGVEL